MTPNTRVAVIRSKVPGLIAAGAIVLAFLTSTDPAPWQERLGSCWQAVEPFIPPDPRVGSVHSE